LVSSNVALLSDDLSRKRKLLEEKRRKLLELEQSYLEEFGDENANDIEVVDIEMSNNNEDYVHEDKNNSSIIEAVVLTKDNTDNNCASKDDGNRHENNEDTETIDNSQNFSNSKEASVELIYDPVLACYFDPKSGKYYEIQR